MKEKIGCGKEIEIMNIRKKRIALCYPRTKKDVRGLSAMPIGILIIGTILKKDYEVKVFDASFDEDISKTFNRIDDFKPDIIGISLLTPFYYEGLKLTKMCKDKEYPVIWGGPHPTIEPKTSLEEEGGPDFVVIGEGEYTFPDLLKNMNKPENVKGIGYKNKGKIIINEPRDRVKEEDLNIIPDRELLETLPKYLKTKIMNIIVYRGCPFNCSFCQPTLRKLLGGGWKIRSPENIVEELKILKEKYHPKRFLFSDDTFTANHEWVRKFVSLIKKNYLKIDFEISTRVNENIFTEEMIFILKSIGLSKISFGVETGSQKILEGLNKGITIKEIKSAFKKCKKYKIDTNAFIMFGAIGETKETLRETESLVNEINPSTLNLSIATPQIGTDLYTQAKEAHRLKFENFRQSDYYGWEFNILPIKNEDIEFKDILEVKNRILKKRRLKFIWYHLKEEIRMLSIKRWIYAIKEFIKRRDKG